MDKSISKRLSLARSIRVGVLILALGWINQAQAQALAPLSANDVSWLFPAPATAQDLAGLISVADVTVPGQPGSVWQDAVFQKFIDIAGSAQAQVAGTSSRIGLPAEAKSIGAWKIAGIRIDAGAPGLSPDIIAQFGQSPQIRLIIQPVTTNADGTVTILDLAAHLIFSVAQVAPAAPVAAGCFPIFKPDPTALKALIADVAALRTKLASGQLGSAKVSTAGVPLGVHPGLKNPATAVQVRGEMLTFLQRHLSAGNLNAMAIMGLPASAPAPWIFLSMLNVPQIGFVPVHGPTLDGQQFAQMLNPVGTTPRVVPVPHNNNLSPITCQNAALQPPLPVAGRSGASTADLFANPSASTAATLDLIADPARSHFFNTDCISCHTETRLRMDNLNVASIAGIDDAALPPGPWTVRNFGWSPPIDGPPRGTVAERTAAETASVVQFVNANLLSP